MLKITFLDPDGNSGKTVEAKSGLTLLDIAHQFEIEIEGVCGGDMACSTCHVFVSEKFLDKIPPISEEEEAILQFAAGRKANSRLGCQITLSDELDGLEVQLPEETESLLF
ncbi:MAG: 2Fe-2S iron-sulfur cluster binding domain-containing protein [Proteobacteria bacterium]|nr:2Fe-2S iron-sulfur cluster binding domain-containing protein [Pseudomonadota bacterium]